MGVAAHSKSPQAKVIGLIAGQIALAAAFALLVTTAKAPVGRPAVVAGFTVAFGLVGRFEMHLEFRRHQLTFSLAEIVLVVALFCMGPVGVALAGGVGEAASRTSQRVRPLKVAFNASNHMCGLMIAAAGFWLLGLRDSRDLAAWAGALAATLCFSLLNLAGLAAVLAVAEHDRFDLMLLRSAPMSLLVTAAAAPVGLIGFDLYKRGAWGPLLLVPFAAAVALNTRYAAHQRDEHLRFERLYGASARTTRLTGFEEAASAVAAEARALLTATSALCCAKTSAGTWIGMIVGDAGAQQAAPETVEAVVGLSFGRPGQELSVDQISPPLRRVLPEAGSVVLVPSADDVVVPVVLAAFRPGGVDGAAQSRIDTLGAFAVQAALAVGNARLFGEVQQALKAEMDLNRQKSDFVAAVSHELRTPLTVMLGSVQTLRRGVDRFDSKQHEQLLAMADQQGLRLKRLIEELLLVASAEQAGLNSRLEVIDVPAVLDEVASGLPAPLAKRLHIEVGPGHAAMVTDRMMLSQILLNLIDNAGKYAPDGPIEVRAASVGADTILSVRDYGPGIPIEDTERVFERFVQLDQSSTRRNGGTGLGLYLCRQLASALGGQLLLHPGDGRGCCFTLVVPTGDVASALTSAAGRVDAGAARA